MDIGPVTQKDGGSDAITCKLSGVVSLDNELLNLIGLAANWQGRVARLWRTIRDVNGSQQGAIQPIITGYMTSLLIGGDPSSQTIAVTIQSYLAAYSGASNRTSQVVSARRRPRSRATAAGSGRPSASTRGSG